MKCHRHRLVIQVTTVLMWVVMGLSVGVQPASGASMKSNFSVLENSFKGHFSQLQQETLYRIQVCASKFKLKNVSNLVAATGDSDLFIEQEGGYFKYLSKAYRRHADAMNAWKSIRKMAGFGGSFLVEYQNGARVTPHSLAAETVNTAKKVQPLNLSSVQEPSKPNTNAKISGQSEEKQQAVQQSVQVDSLQAQGGKTFVSDSEKLSKMGSKRADSLLTVIKQEGSTIFALTQKNAQLTGTNQLMAWGVRLLSVAVLALLVIALLLLILRRRKSARDRGLDQLRIEMGEKLAAYLADPAEVPEVPQLLAAVDDERARAALVFEMIRLLQVLTPEAGKKIKELYFNLGLNLKAAQQLKHRDWTVQARAIFELASMEIVGEADHIAALINHSHPAVRHEAIAAAVKLNTADPLAGLEHLAGTFSLHDQLYVYSILKQNQQPLPDFSRLFDVYNPSVVMFAVEMIQLNRQLTATEGFVKLLHHSYEEVRIKVIKTIGDLQLRQFSGNLIAIFNDEPESVQLLIIKVMVKLDDVLLLNFLSDLVLLNKEMEIRKVAARELVNLGPHGQARMQTLLLNEDADLQHIYAQVTL